MNMLHLLVATITALPCAAMSVLATMKKALSLEINNLMMTPERVGNLTSILTNIAFIGGSIGVIFGLQDDNDSALVFSTVWFIVFSIAADRLATHTAVLRQKDEEEARRDNEILWRITLKRELAIRSRRDKRKASN